MSTSSISAQSIQHVEPTEVVVAPDATTIQKVDDLSVELFQQLVLMQVLQNMLSLAGEYTVMQFADGEFLIVGEENGLPFYCAILVDVDMEPNEETEVSESAESTPFIEEITDSEEAPATAPPAVPEPILVAS